MFFSLPPDARWNEERAAVEFGIGEYEGVLRIARRVFQGLLDRPPRQSGAWRHTICNAHGSN